MSKKILSEKILSTLHVPVAGCYSIVSDPDEIYRNLPVKTIHLTLDKLILRRDDRLAKDSAVDAARIMAAARGKEGRADDKIGGETGGKITNKVDERPDKKTVGKADDGAADDKAGAAADPDDDGWESIDSRTKVRKTRPSAFGKSYDGSSYGGRAIAELVEISEYTRLARQYKDFMDNYLKEEHADALSQTRPDLYVKKKREFKNGDEVISYLEVKEIIQAKMMNSLLGGNHNHVNPGDEQLYEFWKLASHFNFQLSTLIYGNLQF